jgi:membrane-associated phospholipid phosphatase
VLYGLAAGTRAGRTFDARVAALEPHDLARTIATALALCVNPVTVVAAVVALTFWAARGDTGPWPGAPATIVGGSWALAHALEAILGTVDLRHWESQRAIGSGFYPSGHAAVIMALCLTLLTRRSRVARPGALAAIAAVLACPHFLVAWHYPSDVIGGFLVAMTWSAAVSGRLRVTDPPVSGRLALTRRTRSPAALTLAVALVSLWPLAGRDAGESWSDLLLAVAAVAVAAGLIASLFAAALAAEARPSRPASVPGAGLRPERLTCAR